MDLSMPDITMCDDESCPMKSDCYRYRAVPSVFRQSYFMDSPRENETCKEFEVIESGRPVTTALLPKPTKLVIDL